MCVGDWVQNFEVGNGQVIIKESSTGKLLLSVTRLLTPGPLVVSLLASPAAPDPQHYWPPSDDTNIETVAASYVPPGANTAHVRLFNMAPSFPSGDRAGFKIGTKTYADQVCADTPIVQMYTFNFVVLQVNYAGASAWVPVPTTSSTFVVFDDSTGKQIASTTFQPANAPVVNSIFAIGEIGSTSDATKARLVTLIDAPEFLRGR